MHRGGGGGGGTLVFIAALVTGPVAFAVGLGGGVVRW